jgi:hypothetical protein
VKQRATVKVVSVFQVQRFDFGTNRGLEPGGAAGQLVARSSGAWHGPGEN